MDLTETDFERMLFFEHARRNAEAAYATNPLDADNLTRWGGALLELAQFQSGDESVKMIAEAIAKLNEALEVNPQKHETQWCLGNAHSSLAFCTPDHDTAMIHFAKATQCFEKAVEEDPGNDLYKNSLEMSAKAPELHQELQRQMASQKATSSASSTSSTKVPKKKKSSDLKYDVLGWVILAVGIVVWVGLAKSQVPAMPPPPPR
ncbi:mitochondrial import receptor subunit TOM20 isoform X1 [Canna indica]|uniref:Mitochondrial import receptor subunit TOM20 isoform X1 n=1 Tax=Canna indica TaxID=4628 RepID=A0AAQ3L7Y7_9LILI|nr:mitochondrial import receptor subunit TOM20 isoform X1 [Canna indica]